MHKYGYPPKACLMSAIPATFMSAVSVTYILVAPEGFRLSTAVSYPIGIATAVVFFAIFWWRTMIVHKNDTNHRLAK